MADAEWRDMTVVGSAYEQQIEHYTGALRHRPLALRLRGRRVFGEERGVGDWRRGAAPDTNLAEKTDGCLLLRCDHDGNG
jgi:hypothetical protein